MVTEMTDLERIKELVSILNKAGKSYYSEGVEIMSNFEYDKLYDELVKLEEKTKIVLSDSPTVNVGYETLSELPKERHDSPMLSLDKTKNSDELVDWLGSQRGLLSWKLDGLTIVLTYENGELLKAVTRGNGEVGEIITQNAKVFKNIPLNVPFKGHMVLRGEAVISYSEFKRINALLSEEEKAKFKPVAEKLSSMGIYMTGLDVIDEKIIEVNVTSPCYFIKEINNHFGCHLEDKIADYILSMAEKRMLAVV